MIGIDLSGKTILITGALGAIAEHMVRRLAASGAALVLTDIKAEDEARQTLNDWHIPPSSYCYFSADITESGQVAGVVNAAEHVIAVRVYDRYENVVSVKAVVK